MFGLIVCFLTFGAHMLYSPYVNSDDDHLAQLCQCQIFFSLLSSIVLKYDEQTLADATNIDALLMFLTLLPLSLALILETPLEKYVNGEARAEARAELIKTVKRLAVSRSRLAVRRVKARCSSATNVVRVDASKEMVSAAETNDVYPVFSPKV